MIPNINQAFTIAIIILLAIATIHEIKIMR